MFWECELIFKMWKDIESWLNSIQLKLEFTNKIIILGMKGKNNNPVNAIILVAKQYIYRCSIKGYKPNITSLKKEIIRYYDTSRYVFLSTGTIQLFFEYWSSFHLLFGK